MAFQSIVPSEEGLSKAKELAAKALKLDDSLAEAHTSLAYVLPEGGLANWDGAEKEFEKALRFNPSYATAHFWYAIQLLWLHRYSEAIDHGRQAEELDPLSPAISTALGQMLLYSRQYDEAIAHLEKKVMAFPEAAPPHFILGIAYFYNGLYEKAEAEERKALSLASMHERVETVLGMTLFKMGREKEAGEILENLERSGAQFSLQAMFRLELGEKERGIELLHRAFRSKESGLGWISVMPSFDPVRTDRRFLEIMRGLNLPTTPP